MIPAARDTIMTQNSPSHTAIETHNPLIHLTVIGQEGDQASVTINPEAPCAELLRKGLHALYGEPGPNPDEFDLVLGGKWIEPLSQKIEAAGIGNGTTVSILPKSISRGA
jgi:hypothetical protein